MFTVIWVTENDVQAFDRWERYETVDSVLSRLYAIKASGYLLKEVLVIEVRDGKGSEVDGETFEKNNRKKG